MSLRWVVAKLCLATVLTVCAVSLGVSGCQKHCPPKAPHCACKHCTCKDCKHCGFCQKGWPCPHCLKRKSCCDVANPDGCKEEVQNADLPEVLGDELVLEVGKEVDVQYLPIRPDGRGGVGKLTIVLKVPELEKVAEMLQATALEGAYFEGGKDVGLMVGLVLVVVFLVAGVVGKGLALLASALLRKV